MCFVRVVAAVLSERFHHLSARERACAWRSLAWAVRAFHCRLNASNMANQRVASRWPQQAAAAAAAAAKAAAAAAAAAAAGVLRCLGAHVARACVCVCESAHARTRAACVPTTTQTDGRTPRSLVPSVVHASVSCDDDDNDVMKITVFPAAPRGCAGASSATAPSRAPPSTTMNVTWLILPVAICLSQRLSHACLSINKSIL